MNEMNITQKELIGEILDEFLLYLPAKAQAIRKNQHPPFSVRNLPTFPGSEGSPTMTHSTIASRIQLW
jgi:hypothetical protein